MFNINLQILSLGGNAGSAVAGGCDLGHSLILHFLK